jgi:hypothetical protein
MKEFKVPHDRVMGIYRQSTSGGTPEEMAASIVFATISSGEAVYNRYAKIFKNEPGRIQVRLVGSDYIVRLFDEARSP